jgi:drug/metabolite transporter (DMT)-like permease
MTRARANLLLLAAAVLWGGGNAFQKLVLYDVGPFTAVGIRCLVAAFVILPFACREPVAMDSSVERKRLAAGTIICFALAVTLYQVSFGYTTVTNAGFLVNTGSIMTPLAAWAILRCAPPLMVWPAGATALSGVGLMTGGADVSLGFGDILSLLSALFYSLWMVLLGEYVVRYGSAKRITLVQFICVGTCGVCLSLLFEHINLDAIVRVLPELVLLGMLSTGVAYLLEAVAQQYTSASEAAIIVSAEAVFGAMGAYLIFGETLGFIGVIGAAMIMLSIVIVEISPKRIVTALAARLGETLDFMQRIAVAAQKNQARPERAIPAMPRVVPSPRRHGGSVRLFATRPWPMMS